MEIKLLALFTSMLKLESNDTSCAHRSLRKYKAAKLCKYDFKFPWPVVIVVNIGVIFIFIFSLSCITGKKSFVICRFVPFTLPLY